MQPFTFGFVLFTTFLVLSSLHSPAVVSTPPRIMCTRNKRKLDQTCQDCYNCLPPPSPRANGQMLALYKITAAFMDTSHTCPLMPHHQRRSLPCMFCLTSERTPAALTPALHPLSRWYKAGPFQVILIWLLSYESTQPVASLPHETLGL